MKIAKARVPNLMMIHEKHGFPLHIAVLSHKLDVALRMLRLGPPAIDPHVLTSIGANVVHLLFVKYEKDAVTGFEILKECLKLGLDVNHVDTLKAAPLHVALRKRQYQVLADCAKINAEEGRAVFDLNALDKKEQTPLHYAVDKQDHQLFNRLLECKTVDVFKVDQE